jgi:hypothetical protein
MASIRFTCNKSIVPFAEVAFYCIKNGNEVKCEKKMQPLIQIHLIKQNDVTNAHSIDNG